MKDDHFYASGFSPEALNYIEEFHAHDADDDGFPMLDVEAYFDDGDMMLGPDADADIEQSVYNAARLARDAGHLHVVFTDY